MAFEVYDLYVKIGVDSSGFDKGLADAKKKLNGLSASASKSIGETESKTSGMLSKIGGGLASFGKAALSVAGEVAKVTAQVTTAAVGAAGAGVVALTKMAVSSYGEYQQLTGGIETLFKSSSDQMMQYADNAFKTAGISKNRYMTIAIESSAAMINSLGGDTKKAAEYTNMAITDMSDNVNKMGTTFDSLQNAYRGFSRGNFTMLDNLSLGFAGSKQGMQELLDKAEELSGIKYDIGSYSDIVQAIHVVQQEMGITGTTAAEAAGTITGSMGSVKAAWENLVTGLADPKADIGKLIQDLVDTGTKAIENLVPTIVNALHGISQLIERIVPIIGERLPQLIDAIVPSILNAATSVVKSLVAALPHLIDILAEEIPKVLNTLFPVIIEGLTALAQGIAKVLPKLAQVIADNTEVFVKGVVDILKAIGDAVITTFPILFPALVKVAVGVISQLAEEFKNNSTEIVGGILDVVDTIVTTLTDPDVMNPLLDSISLLIDGLCEGIENNEDKFEGVVEKILDGIGALIVAAAPRLLDALLSLIGTLLTSIIPAIVEGLWNIGLKLGQFLKDTGHSISVWIQETDEDITNFSVDLIRGIQDWASDAWQSIKNFFSDLGEYLNGLRHDFWNWGSNIIHSFWDGLQSFFGHIRNGMADFGRSIVNGVKSVFQIASPSKVMKKIGVNVGQGLSEGIKSSTKGVLKDVQTFGRNIIRSFEGALEIASPSKLTKKDGMYFAQGFGLGATNEFKKQFAFLDNFTSKKTEELGNKLGDTFNNNKYKTEPTLGNPQAGAQGNSGGRGYDLGALEQGGIKINGKSLAEQFRESNQTAQLLQSTAPLLNQSATPWVLNQNGYVSRLMGGQANALWNTIKTQGAAQKTTSGSHGGGGGYAGGGSYGGGYGSGIDYSNDLDEIKELLKAAIERDPTFVSDMILDNTKIGAIITAINADNKVRNGGY